VKNHSWTCSNKLHTRNSRTTNNTQSYII